MENIWINFMIELKIVKEIPSTISLTEIIRVINEFYNDCDMYIDKYIFKQITGEIYGS